MTGPIKVEPDGTAHLPVRYEEKSVCVLCRFHEDKMVAEEGGSPRKLEAQGVCNHPANRDPDQRKSLYSRASAYNKNGDCPRYSPRWLIQLRQWLGIYPTVYR